MAIERPVLHNPVPKDYAPSKVWYKVTDLDDWSTVASKYGVRVRDLILFNFKTTNTDEVNWYLRRNLGCNVSRDGGRNWAFSNSAWPGKVYIPAGKIDFDPEPSPEPSGRNNLAKLLDNLPEDSEKWEYVHKGLELFEFAHITVEIFEGVTEGAAAAEGTTGAVTAGEGAGTVGGTLGLGGAAAVLAPFAGMAALAIALGSPYLDQVNLYKRKAMLWGLGQGIVLGANKNVHVSWLKSNFDTNMPISVKNLITIPGQENQFVNVKKAYLQGLGAGFTYGRQLNATEAARLYKVLGAEVNPNTIDRVGSPQYYFEYGTECRIKFLPPA